MHSDRTKTIAFCGILVAMLATISFIENIMPPLAFMPLGVKPGFSNVITMYCVFFLGGKIAFCLVILKSFFAMFTRGLTAGLLSFLGGLFSVGIMLSLNRIKNLNKTFLSIAGAIFHNIGQIVGAYIILQAPYIFYYIPILLISGVLMGTVTGITLRLIMPYLKRIEGHFKIS